MSDEMVHVARDLTRAALERGLEGGGSLADALKAREKGSGVFSINGSGVLLIDTSGSMGEMIEFDDSGAGNHVRKIDRLREVVDQVRAQCPAEMVSFGRTTGIISEVEEPGGSTPLDQALQIAADNGFHHLVVISDGQPNNPEAALAIAKANGFLIDTCFVGTADAYGEKFLEELAHQNGGTSQRGDLTEPLQLTRGIVGLLGEKKKAIQL
jgi:hypothetical protein